MNTENNKIIAEFLGYDTIVGITVVSVIKHNQLMVFNPNSDWNWLMEVVEKIESLEYIEREGRFSISSINFEDNYTAYIIDGGNGLLQVEGETKIQAVYNACIEFIKWHNEQK